MVSPSPTFSADQAASINKILSDAVASGTTGAVFFGVTTTEGPIYLHATGPKSIDDPDSAGDTDEDAVFWLCSQTKLVATIAALQLIEQGKIALDTPVETVLPELANPMVITAYDEEGRPKDAVPARNKILFGQLLNHTSGLSYGLDGALPPMALGKVYSHSYKDGDVSTFFELLKGSFPGVPIRFEPGTNFAYGFSTDCAGFVVERLTGQSLEQYFQDHIAAPLGIKSMSFYLTPDLKNRLLPLLQRNSESGKVEKRKGPPPFDQDPAHVRVHLAGVGMYASQKDYLTLLRHLLQIQSGTATNPLLSVASVNSMFEHTLSPAGVATLIKVVSSLDPDQAPEEGRQFGYGLLVNTVDVPNKRRAGSGAWGGWASTSYFMDPITGIAAVFGMQVAPTDSAHERILEVLEREVYQALSS